MSEGERVSLPVDERLWTQFFFVAPLLVVGTREPDGRFDLAPKHRAMPVGRGPFFAFACTPHHATHRNVQREQAFTVSFIRPGGIAMASLTSAPRDESGKKPIVELIDTHAASVVNGPLVDDAHVWLECELHQLIDGFDGDSLIIGRIVAASAREEALRVSDGDDNELVHRSPLIAYLHPGRWARVDRSDGFPYPLGFEY